ncbi:CAP [Mytilus edulis]|uniref:SORBS1 n=1 Tax=Mytilus edulis TaxID=6550 RepID=A0A8S3PSA3_MYTED|nr:CAP [Mytilus edulis]
MLARSTAHLEVTGGRISKLKTDQNPKQSNQSSSAGYKRDKCNVIPVRSPASGGDAQSIVSGFSGFQPELHSTPKSSIVDSHRPTQRQCGKPDLLNSAPNQSHTNYLQNDKTKLGLINTGHCNVSSLIGNRHKCDKDLIESPKKQNSNMDYHTMTENVRKFAGSPSAFPESKVTQNMEDKAWDNLLEDEHKVYDRPPSRAKLSRSARGSVSSEKSSRLDSHTYQSYTAGLLHSTSRSEKFLNLQKNYAMLERISEIEEKSEKPMRPNSMDPQTFQDMFDIVNTSRQEELDELYFELEEAKRNREFFSSVKSQTWDPRRDYSLTRKEKSVGDLKALYAGLESQTDECYNSPLQEKVYVQNPQRSPRGARAIHGTSIEPLANKYEIYVEKKQKEYKDTPNNEELHVRSVSVPVNELESPKPLKRAHSSIGNKIVTNVDSKIYVKEPELSVKQEKTQIRHGGKVIASYVNDSVHGVNFRYRTNSNENSEVNTNIRDNSGVNSPRTNSLIQEKSGTSDNYERIWDNETNVFHRHFGEKCVLDERDKLPLQKVNAMKSCSLEKIHNLEEPKQNVSSSQSPVQFRVRNLRVLAENNEFSDSKFAKMRPISDSVSPSGFENRPLSFGTNEKETELLIKESDLDSADDYVRLKKWRTSELCENDGTNSENSSTDTFIVKSSEDEIEKDGDNLPDVTKGTESNSKLPEEPAFEKSKSEPDLKQVNIRKEPVRPRSAKSHVKLNEPVKDNKLPTNFGMPRTVSGNLREVFKQYKHEGKFSRFQAPEHKADSPKSQTLPRTSRVSNRRYDAYIPPSHIMKEVTRDSDQYKRTEPIHKDRTPSSASKMTVEYLDLIGNEWSQERNKQSIVNSPRSNSQGHRRDGDYVQLKENNNLSNIKIKSASLGRHPKKQDYPDYYHTWSPRSPSGHYNQQPTSAGHETRPHRNQPPPYPRHRTNPSNSEKPQQHQQQQSPLSPLPPKVPPPPKLSPVQQPIIKSSTSYNQLYSKFESQGNSYTNRFGYDPPAPPVRGGNFHEPPNPPVRKIKSAPVSKLRIRSNLSAAEQLGIKSSSPKLNGAFKFQTSDVRRSPTERVQRRREDEEEYRRKRLEQIYEEERRRKIEQEKADLEARKHNDFFTQEIYMDAAQKSPIPADRFEEPISGYNTVPADRRRGFKIHGKAKAVYNFNAQNPRELSFRKGDIIYLLRQIDKNWFEGERYGRSGLFPVNYVEVLTSIEEAHTAAQQAEGQARVRYNFTAQTGVELTLRKGDIVTLLRSVDENWYEGRVGNKQGIFPRSYIEVIFDPSTPLVTPAPSVITTPMTGTPEMLSPSGYDAPTPPPQPSPRAFSPRSSAFQHHQQRQFSPQQQGMSPHQQTLSPQQQGMSPHQQSFSPQQQGLSPHQQTFSASQQGLNSHQPAFSPQRSSYTSPRYDGPQQQRMEDGPVRVNGYSQYNGDYNGSPQHQGQQQGRPRQSPTIGRKQFVSNGPSYPPSANINYNVETNNNEIRNKVPDDDLALCRYRAVFAYRPQNDDELELLEGDEVYVMEKCDDGWKLCTINSMTNQNLL